LSLHIIVVPEQTVKPQVHAFVAINPGVQVGGITQLFKQIVP